ncbi:MAG: hypothetical protein WC656_01540 [Sulfurimonas sp.]|jgi:hypothetical protein
MKILLQHIEDLERTKKVLQSIDGLNGTVLDIEKAIIELKFVVDNFELAPKNPPTGVCLPFVNLPHIKSGEQSARTFYMNWLQDSVSDSSNRMQDEFLKSLV